VNSVSDNDSERNYAHNDLGFGHLWSPTANRLKKIVKQVRDLSVLPGMPTGRRQHLQFEA